MPAGNVGDIEVTMTNAPSRAAGILNLQNGVSPNPHLTYMSSGQAMQMALTIEYNITTCPYYSSGAYTLRPSFVFYYLYQLLQSLQ